MNTNLEELLDRVRHWPAARQEKAQKLLETLERLDDHRYRLTGEQIEEVRRRMADPNPRLLTAEQVKTRFLTPDA